jgi:hypothetical protein
MENLVTESVRMLPSWALPFAQEENMECLIKEE